MYRLMLYVLISFLLVATLLSFFGILSFNPISLIFSAVFLTAVCWMTNTVFAKVFKAPTNLESVYITALILTLIVAPVVHSYSDAISLGWVAVLAMAGKYIIAINKKHIFNPAALAVFITAIALNYSASWWIGNFWMAPFVVIGGLLVVRKIRKFNMVFVFLITAGVLILGVNILRGNGLSVIQKVVFETPLFFFAFIMLTEPQTFPPTKKWQIVYGSLVGILFAPFVHIGSFYFTPETALLAGNIFSYIVSPKDKLLPVLKQKIQIAPDIYDFIFEQSEKRTESISGLNQKFAFLPGQYMEWTLGHKNPDSRGSRRYFTLASSPTEGDLRIGVKFYPNGSSFKKALLGGQGASQIVASQLAGEFTLPKDPNKKLCFIAGGIGITPFRSMIKYLLDTNQKRDIVLLYSVKTGADIVYRDIFDLAWQNLEIRTVYVVTDKAGCINEAMIEREVTDFKDRMFYISGPHSMVDVFGKTLTGMGLNKKQIKVDFFPGYA